MALKYNEYGELTMAGTSLKHLLKVLVPYYCL